MEIFHINRKVYGTRKIKAKLQERGLIASRRRIGRIMKEQSLVSTYTVTQFKPHKTACNEEKTANKLEREFDQAEAKRFVVSDLTYVKVGHRWHYICVLIDLFDREIIGHSVGPHKDTALVSRAFATVEGDLSQIQWFHTERESEFKNHTMDQLLGTFGIGRSISKKGCPYDNAVAEATYKVMKTEFIYQMEFRNLRHLELELYDYVNWFNRYRVHGSLGYLTPVQYRQEALKKLSDLMLTIQTHNKKSRIVWESLLVLKTLYVLFLSYSLPILVKNNGDAGFPTLDSVAIIYSLPLLLFHFVVGEPS
ncbi:transposase InsO family protein [Paenibacillus sp. 2003]|nr:transposase InsO family protein [Paenibacillus sp. 2003]